MTNHLTQKQEQKPCDYSGCRLEFLNKNPEFFDGNKTHQEEQHNAC